VEKKELAGFALAYRPPKHSHDLFIWQIGVHPLFRGRGVGKQILHHLCTLEANQGVQYITATIAKSNEPSQALFRSFALGCGVEIRQCEFFTAEMFPGDGGDHEAEELFRVGPLGRSDISAIDIRPCENT